LPVNARYLIGIGIAGLAGLVVGFPPHRHIETTIRIAASPGRVWAVLTDTPAYPTWNPEIAALNGELKPGSVLENKEGYGKDQIVFWPSVLVAKPPQELRWLGHLGVPRLFDAEHYFLLQPDANGTRFIQGELFRGVLLWIFDVKLLLPTFDAMNAALKIRAER
jgi:hypothetical protein